MESAQPESAAAPPPATEPAAADAAAPHAAAADEAAPEAVLGRSTITVIVQLPNNSQILMERVDPSELVLSLKHILSAQPTACHFTAYHLELVVPSQGKGKGKRKRRTVVLNDFVEIERCPDMHDCCTLLLVPDHYTVLTAREHVRRLRDILANPPPSMAVPEGEDLGQRSSGDAPAADRKRKGRKAGATATTTEPAAAAPAEAAQAKPASAETAPAENAQGSAADGSDVAIVANEAASSSATSAASETILEEMMRDLASKEQRRARQEAYAQIKQLRPKMESEPLPVPCALDSIVPALHIFNRKLCEYDTPPAKPAPPKCVNRVLYSGWNPPPPARRMLGDLCYLDAQTLEGVEACITCTPAGFFVNSTRGSNFNPAPNHQPCFGATLVDTLSQLSPQFRRLYPKLFPPTGTPFVTDPVDQMLSTPFDAATSPDALTLACKVAVRLSSSMARNDPSPNVPSLATLSRFWYVDPALMKHEFNPNRAEDDLLETQGAEEQGVTRDFNEEFQTCRDVPADSQAERVARARLLVRVHHDFVETATLGAIQISQGRVTPMNPMEDPRLHVFLFANLFISYAHEDLETYGGVGVDPLPYSTANADLLSIINVNAAEVPGLHTLLIAIIDFKGQRYLAQSVIPGLLHDQAVTKLLYGSVNDGRAIACNEEMHEKMCALGKRLMMAERRVKPRAAKKDEPEEPALSIDVSLAQKEEPVPLVGPVNCKGLRGSDGRMYLLDMVRTTPRDLVYYDELRAREEAAAAGSAADAAGTGKRKLEAPFMADGFKREGAYVALLRPELVAQYAAAVQRQLQTTAMMQAVHERNKRLTKKKQEQERKAGEAAAAAEGAAAEGAAAPTTEGAGAADSGAVTDGADAAAAAAPATNGAGEDDDDSLQVPIVEMPALQLNVNLHFDNALDEPADVLQRDENLVREVSAFLHQTVLPQLVADLVSNAATVTDGGSLTSLMHERGVNLRLLGRVATMLAVVESQGKTANHFALEVCEMEMVARVCKRILGATLRSNTDARAAPAPLVAKFLNLMLGAPSGSAEPVLALDAPDEARAASGAGGAGSVPGPTATAPGAAAGSGSRKRGGKGGAPALHMLPTEEAALRATSALPATHAEFWQLVRSKVAERYDYQLQLWRNGPQLPSTGQSLRDSLMLLAEEQPEPAQRTHHLPLLRRVCQRCGIRVLAVNYNFGVPAPFAVPHVVDMVPVVKHSMPSVPLPEVRELLSAGQVRANMGDLSGAVDLVGDAVSLLYHAVGTSHRDVADACAAYAVALHSLGRPLAALSFQQRATAISERILGFDHPDVAHSRGNLALFLHPILETPFAVRQMRRCLAMLELAGGPSHPEAASIYLKLGVFLKDIGLVTKSLQSMVLALTRCNNDDFQYIATMHAIASTYAHAQVYREAVRYQRRAHALCLQRCGPKDKRTVEAAALVQRYTELAVEAERSSRAQEQVEDEASWLEEATRRPGKGKSRKGRGKGKH